MKMLSKDEVIIICVALAVKKKKNRKGSKKGRIWAKEWFLNKEKYTHERLLNDLRVIGVKDFRNFVRMNTNLFDILLGLVAPEIQKKDTIMREAIPATQRLAITLRYLATGNTFEDLKFISALSPFSISSIIMETCSAIIKALKEYIKVSNRLTPFQIYSTRVTRLCC